MNYNEIIKELLERQTEVLALQVWIKSNRQIGYTQNQTDKMFAVLTRESLLDKKSQELMEFIEEHHSEELMAIITNRDLMQAEYKFTLEQQKEVIKNTIGLNYTVEELMEWAKNQ